MLLAPVPSLAEVFLGKNQAIELAFPAADRVERRTHVLTRPEADELEEASNSELPSRLITIYEGWKGEDLLGYMHIDVHPVRARSAAVMIVVDPRGRVTDVVVLAFHEDTDYMLPRRSINALKGKRVGDALEVGTDVDAVSGATLTIRSTAAALRRMLAYYTILLKGAQAPADSQAGLKPRELP
jgi:transcriptional regulator of nitric oxide reductase